MNFTIRSATTDDADEMLALLPRLADFDVPATRNPDHLWQGDRAMLQQWIDGLAPEVHVQVAVAENNVVLGVSIISLREEMLSHEPSAHLEVLALSKGAEGFGIGKALIQSSEALAEKLGATSMSLHVFAKNTRARGLYEHMGYDGELLRYYKPL